jgi:hypothetical protein
MNWGSTCALAARFQHRKLHMVLLALRCKASQRRRHQLQSRGSLVAVNRATQAIYVVAVGGLAVGPTADTATHV